MSINALSVVTDSDPLLGLRGMLYGFGSGGVALVCGTQMWDMSRSSRRGSID